MTDQLPEEQGSTRLRPALGGLVLLSCAFGFLWMSRVIFGPLLPAIEKDLGLSHTASSSLFLISSVGAFSAVILVGFITARITHRSMIIIATLGLGLEMLALSQVHSLNALRLGMLLIGFTTGTYFPSGVATVTTLLKPRLWARGLAIHDMAPTLNFLIAPLLAEMVLLWTDWRGVLVVSGSLNLTAGLVFLRYGRGGRFTGRKPDYSALKELLGRPSLWIMALIWGLGSGSSQGIFNILPLYLIEVTGLDRSQANLTLSVTRVLPVIFLLFCGWLADALGHRRAMIGALMLGGAATMLLGLGHGRLMMGALFAQPAIMALFFPSAFALISAQGDDKTRSLLISLTLAGAMIIGIGVVPQAFGWLGDHGLFQWGMFGLGGLMVLMALLNPLGKRR